MLLTIDEDVERGFTGVGVEGEFALHDATVADGFELERSGAVWVELTNDFITEVRVVGEAGVGDIFDGDLLIAQGVEVRV